MIAIFCETLIYKHVKEMVLDICITKYHSCKVYVRLKIYLKMKLFGYNFYTITPDCLYPNLWKAIYCDMQNLEIDKASMHTI
ncbi:hypothetical protein NHP164001_09410 [Helicobacter trogontum]|uniref:Uncharacterized protein n=1 Tax=Helicobacter trogontum TaxID=50960 RepID=A0ABQ0D3K5_9HELI